MKKALLIFFATLSLLHKASADEAKHREQGAHVHGAAKVDIAFDQLNGEVDYDGAAINIIGFEHPATTPQDKKALEDSLKKFETSFPKIIQFDPSLGCKTISSTANLEKNGAHADVNAHIKLTCAKSPLNSKIKIDFAKDYPTLKKIQVQLLVDSLQKSQAIDSFPAEIEVK